MTTNSDAKARLNDQWWRLNNLYYIKDKRGKKIKFRPNWAQKIMFRTMWYLNIILKARQLGMTTFIQIFMLDVALFNDNQSCGVVAHTKEDAEAFFEDKIKYAYDNLPDELKKARAATSDSKRHMKFSNGSQIRVGTSLRSGTYQYVHVSEFGKLCAKFPEKADEVITGTLNTVVSGQFVFIESTAEGPFGAFYEMCRKYRDFGLAVENGDADYTPMDYRFFFFPWWDHPDYTLDATFEIPDKLFEYFDELDKEYGIKLTHAQKMWYVKKQAEQQQQMKQEYPSTVDEAFERATELAIYGKQLVTARAERRICQLPTERGIPVNTFWDLGRNDMNAIWFHQRVDQWDHFIYYLESRLNDLSFYVDQLNELKVLHNWVYGTHHLPHDAAVVDVSSRGQKSRERVLNEAGLRPTIVVPRIKNLNDGIEITRKAFSKCRFDAEGCEVGLAALNGYEWTYDERMKTTRMTAAHSWASNGADAFRQYAQGYRGPGHGFRDQVDKATGAGERRYTRGRNTSRRNNVFNPSTKHVI